MIFVLDSNALCHQMWHMGASKIRKETGDHEAMPDLSDVLDWFMIRLDHLREYVGKKSWGVDARFVCVFDSTSKSFRTRLVEDYKAQRTRVAAVYELVSEAKQAVALSDEWTCLEAPDSFEADDLIASLATQRRMDERVMIHSPDKDFNQCLVPGRVSIIKRSGMMETDFNASSIRLALSSELEAEHFTAADFVRRYGFPVDRWIDFQCMAGDAADNVKGCPWVGEKTASEILKAFPNRSLERLSYGMLCTEKFLNKRQAAEWPAFIKRLPTLRCVFALRTELRFELGAVGV